MPQKYHVVETTDLRNRTKSYRIYERGPIKPPVVSGFATREEAQSRLDELEGLAETPKP